MRNGPDEGPFVFMAVRAEAAKIKNTDIVNELRLPPVKIHCSVLAEDAIKAALADYREKHATAGVAASSK